MIRAYFDSDTNMIEVIELEERINEKEVEIIGLNEMVGYRLA